MIKLEYNYGIVSALALLEAPARDESSEAEKNDSTPQEDKGKGNLRKKVLDFAQPVLLVNLFLFTVFELLWRAGYMEKNPLREMGGIASTVAVSIYSLQRPPNTKFLVAKQSVARRHLSRTRFILTGLNLFIPYMAASLAGMYVISDLSLPMYMASKLSLGLLLMSIHTAWLHTVLSKSTDKSVWQRMPGGRDWLALVPVASLDIVLPDAVYHLTQSILKYFQGTTPREDISPRVFVFSTAAPLFLYLLAAIVTRAVYAKVAASMLPVDDMSILSVDHEGPERRLSTFEAARRITKQDWLRYLGIVHEAILYEYLWVALSCVVIAAEIHYHDSCAIIELLVWLSRDW